MTIPTSPTTTASYSGTVPHDKASSGRQPAQDLMEYLKDYARDKPEVMALWCLGVGFVLGWKLKPW